MAGAVVFSSVATLWAPGGESFTSATLARMRFLARQAVTEPSVVWLARSLAAQSGDGHQGRVVAQIIHNWLASHVVFVADPTDQEMLSRPADIVAQVEKYGRVGMDCDEIATFGAALLLSVGLPATFRVYKFAGASMYGHVFTYAPGPNGGVSLDIQTMPQGVQVVKVADYPV